MFPTIVFLLFSGSQIEQQKKSEIRDQPRTDHSTISAKPHFNALLPPAPFHKECNSFCKEIANSGNVTAIRTSRPILWHCQISFTVAPWVLFNGKMLMDHNATIIYKKITKKEQLDQPPWQIKDDQGPPLHVPSLWSSAGVLGKVLMTKTSQTSCPPWRNHCVIVVPLDIHLRSNDNKDTTISRKRGWGGRSWRLRPIIAWYCYHLIAVAIIGGSGGGMQRALPVREEEELPLSCAATAAENGYDNWRGWRPDGYHHCQLSAGEGRGRAAIVVRCHRRWKWLWQLEGLTTWRISPLPTSPMLRGMGGNEERSLPWQHDNNNYNKEEAIQLCRTV